ncbi:MAG: hypothetical protein RSE94_02250 [Pseudomonas sp.]
MEKKTYRLTADIGDKKRGETIKLTDEKAASPLYASRIAPVDAGGVTVTVDVEAIRTELRKELEAEAKKIVEAAQAEAKKIVEAAQAEAMKLASGNGKK